MYQLRNVKINGIITLLFQIIGVEIKTSGSAMRWLFQGNPKYYKVIEAIRDFEQLPWTVTRYVKDPVLKDLTVIRQPNSTNFKVTKEQWQRVFELRGQG
jgi:IS4 transposase